MAFDLLARATRPCWAPVRRAPRGPGGAGGAGAGRRHPFSTRRARGWLRRRRGRARQAARRPLHAGRARGHAQDQAPPHPRRGDRAGGRARSRPRSARSSSGSTTATACGRSATAPASGAARSASCATARALRDGRARHGEPSRWTGGRDLEWIALRPELVVEVSYDHVSDGRIRHGARLLRWRDDRDPRSARRPARRRGVSAAARLRAQGLGEARARDAHGAVAAALAIQAQDTRSSRLGVRARSEGLGSRTWCGRARTSARWSAPGRCAGRCTCFAPRTSAGCSACSARSSPASTSAGAPAWDSTRLSASASSPRSRPSLRTGRLYGPS